MAKKKKKYIVKHKIKEKDEIKNKELSMEEKFYWSRVITGVLSGILGAWPIQLVGWWMFLYMMCFQFLFPFFLSFVVFRLPYKKGKWDWKNILKTGIGVNFFIFLFASTAVHTIVIYPEWSDQLHNHADTNEFIVSDEIAYTADGTNGLLILNISNINDRTLLGKFETEGSANNIIVINDTIYLTVDNFLYLIDSSDLSNPEEIKHYNTSGKISDIAVQNDIVYLTDEEQGLIILDTAGEIPNVIGDFNVVNSTFQSIYIENEIAYVTTKNHGLNILNVSQPNLPQPIGECELNGSLNSIYINGTVAFITAEDQGFHLVNITNLYDPRLINTFNTTGNSTDILVDGNMVYVTDNLEGIIRYELSSYLDTAPDSTNHTLNGIANKMFIDNNYMYVSKGTKGIEIINLSEFGVEEDPAPDSSISFGWGWVIFSFLSIGLIILGINKKIKRKIL
ncbi:MAG: LVIVD repeat-containing protein [Promethearchaeota archaeon]